ncbi:MAG: hypothetical protein JWP74_2480 [Marmoricola sp.]|nr:hypothetical protein [Marmoricola sp.]
MTTVVAATVVATAVPVVVPVVVTAATARTGAVPHTGAAARTRVPAGGTGAPPVTSVVLPGSTARVAASVARFLTDLVTVIVARLGVGPPVVIASWGAGVAGPPLSRSVVVGPRDG